MKLDEIYQEHFGAKKRWIFWRTLKCQPSELRWQS
jgi:hypothetical protein